MEAVGHQILQCEQEDKSVLGWAFTCFQEFLKALIKKTKKQVIEYHQDSHLPSAAEGLGSVTIRFHPLFCLIHLKCNVFKLPRKS